MMQNYYKVSSFLIAGALLAMAMMVAVPGPIVAEEQPPQESHDGLKLVSDRKIALAYLDSNADLSLYDKVMILDCYVAFRKDWEKDKQKPGSRVHISASDVERLKADTSTLFRDVFTEKLAENDGYEIVNAAGEGVLLIRPAIIDLDIEAPDVSSAGRSRTYTTTAGSATLYIELYDSVTGDILARAVDKKVARSAGGYLSYTNRVTNQAEARRMLGKWADLLRDKLDEIHGK
jgi:hypothetical protein